MEVVTVWYGTKTLWSKTNMSNLRLINETTASSVSSVDITDVFIRF